MSADKIRTPVTNKASARSAWRNVAVAFLTYRDLLVGPATPARGPGIGNCDADMIGAQ